MYHDRQDLTALIGSRICHDLISPLGAISNGLELLSMSGEAPSPELQLIADSIASANSRIRFFRIAYGRTPLDATLATPEILSVLGDYFHGSRPRFTWHPVQEVLRREVRLVFLAIQCLESALPYGGQIDVFLSGRDWEVVAESERLSANSGPWSLLQGRDMGEPLGAAQVEFGLLAMLTLGRAPGLLLEKTENRIVIRL
jgi:histidine phosphotransferase ChpT